MGDVGGPEMGRPRVANPPPIGAQQESMVTRPLSDDTAGGPPASRAITAFGKSGDRLSDVLDRHGIPYTSENSNSNSASLGPSLSKYFRVQTPHGDKTIRISDHEYVAPDGGLDLRYGTSADEAAVKILRLTGRPIPNTLSHVASEMDARNNALIAKFEAEKLAAAIRDAKRAAKSRDGSSR